MERRFGTRSDGAYPIGAFYTLNIDNVVRESAGGIWYRPVPLSGFRERNIREEDIELFLGAIETGKDIQLRSGKVVSWEEVPEPEASLLPR